MTITKPGALKPLCNGLPPCPRAFRRGNCNSRISKYQGVGPANVAGAAV